MSVSGSLAGGVGRGRGVVRTIVVMVAASQPRGGWPAVEGGDTWRSGWRCSRTAEGVFMDEVQLRGRSGQSKRLCQQGGE